MKLSNKNNVSILSLPSEVLGGTQVIEFSSLVEEALDSNPTKVIVDLTNVKVLNSSGLGMIVGAHTSCTKNKCNLVIAAPSEKILELFKITNLTQILTINDTLESAISVD
jgi:anti-sigma B factor antagonist